MRVYISDAAVIQAIARHADLDVTLSIYAYTNLDAGMGASGRHIPGAEYNYLRASCGKSTR